MSTSPSRTNSTMIAAAIRIRPEVASDKEAIYKINAAAFDAEAEAKLVDTLRDAIVGSGDVSNDFVSLVAEVDVDNPTTGTATTSTIVGHILFTPVTLHSYGGGSSQQKDEQQQVSSIRIAGLAPLAVSPDHQKKGIGAQLVEAGLAACKQKGFVASVVLGHSQYYPRFGFKPSQSTFHIKSAYDVPDEVFMAIELEEGALSGADGGLVIDATNTERQWWVVKYHPAFAADGL